METISCTCINCLALSANISKLMTLQIVIFSNAHSSESSL